MNADRNTPYGTKVMVNVGIYRGVDLSIERVSFRGWFIGPSMEEPEHYGIAELASFEKMPPSYKRWLNMHHYENLVIKDWEQP